MNHCFMSCIQRALKSAAPKLKRQFCGSASNTKADSEKGRGSEKRQYDLSPEFTVVASNGLRSTLTRSKFKDFLGEHAPRPPYKTVHALYT